MRSDERVDERIHEDVLRWFGHAERTEKDRIAKRVYVVESAGSRLVGRPRKSWIDTVKDCLRKKGLDVRQARRMVQYGREWRGSVRECMRHILGGESQTFARCHSCGLWVEICLWPRLQLKGCKGENLFFFSFVS